MMRILRCAIAAGLLASGLPVWAQNPAAAPAGAAAPAAAAPAAADPAANQAYAAPIAFKVDVDDKRKFRDLQKNKSNILKGISPLDAAGQQMLKDWFEGYVFPAMTNPDYFHVVGELRRDITRELEGVKQADVHDFVVQLLLNDSKKLLEFNYPPATRINALLLISELNAVERGAGSSAEAVPLPVVLPYLRQKLTDANEMDGVRLVALAGIHRHIESQWWGRQPPAPDLINQLRLEMLAIINETLPPSGRSAEAHAWFRGRAADVLGSLCGWLPDVPSFEALAGILADEKASISLRCRAAYAIGRFDYSKLAGTGNVKLDELSGHIAGLLADACKTEVTWLEKERETVSNRGASSFGPTTGAGAGPGGASMAPGGMMGGGAMPFSGGASGGGERDEDSTSGGNSFGSFPFNNPSSGSSSSSSEGGARKTPQPQTGGIPRYIVDGSRRRLIYELQCIQESVAGPGESAQSPFKGLKSLAKNDANVQEHLTTIEEEVDKLLKELKRKDYKLSSILKETRGTMQKVEPLRPQQPEAAAATEEGGDIPGADDLPTTTEGAADDVVPAGENAPLDTTIPDDAAPAAAGDAPAANPPMP